MKQTAISITYHKVVCSKGQFISKQNCRVVTSPKKQMKCTQDTILSGFHSVFGRSYGSIIFFQGLLTFNTSLQKKIKLFMNPKTDVVHSDIQIFRFLSSECIT